MNKSRILGLIGSGVFALIAIIVVFAIGVKFSSPYDELYKKPIALASNVSELIVSKDIMNKFKGLYATGLVFALIGALFAVLAIFLKDKTGRIMIVLELVFIILGMLVIVSGTANFVSEFMKPIKDSAKLYGVDVKSSDVFNTGILAANYILTLAGGIAGITLAALSIKFDR
jgi:hypothetical protein